MQALTKICGTILFLLCSALPCCATELNLLPWPSHITQQDGFLALDHAPKVELAGGDERVSQALQRFIHDLSVQTGGLYDRKFSGLPDGPRLVIHCEGNGLRIQTLEEDESYHLTVNQAGIELSAANPLGVMHGLQTLLQLVEAGPNGWRLPYVQIDDTPRFAWRGLMIDVSRHFQPLDALKRNIDGMAAVKLNILHLHLSDDEGFRVESKRSPKLTQLSSDGLFYTQDQVRDLIAYAWARGIRIVPEFDLPGHAVSWLVAYPELASGPPPQGLVRSQRDDLRPPLNPTQEETYKLLDRVFGEMEQLFPDAYFHIGGDEVNGKYWDQDPKIQAWMKAHDIKDNHALQTYFTQRVQKIVEKHGKHMEGWDEILDGNLPKDSLIQSWRGSQSLADSAKAGYKTVLSAGYYLDLMYPASKHYAVDPTSGPSASLTPEEKSRIIGGEAAEWTEYATPEILDNRLWPRLGAIAERLWSPASVTDVASMYNRLAVLSRNLEWLGLEHRTSSQRMLGRIIGNDMPAELLQTLASAVEPVKEYDREKTQVYDVEAPLNQLADADSPESNDARRFNQLAIRAVKDPSARPELRRQLVRWRDNDAQLAPYLGVSMLRAPLAPLSKDLAALATLGLSALDAMETAQPVTGDSHKQHLADLNVSSAHHAEMLIAIAPGIQTLVEAEPVSQ